MNPKERSLGSVNFEKKAKEDLATAASSASKNTEKLSEEKKEQVTVKVPVTSSASATAATAKTNNNKEENKKVVQKAIKNTEQKSVEKDIKAPVFASTVATPATSTKQEKQEDSKGKNEKSGMAKELSSKIVPDVKVDGQVPKASSVFVGSLDFEKEEKSKTNYVKGPEYSFGGSYKSTAKKSASTKPIPDPAKAVSASEKVMTQEKTTTTRQGKSSSTKKQSEKQATACVENGTKKLKRKHIALKALTTSVAEAINCLERVVKV